MGGNLSQCSTNFHIKTTTNNNTKHSFNILDTVNESWRSTEVTGGRSDLGQRGRKNFGKKVSGTKTMGFTLFLYNANHTKRNKYTFI